MYNALNNSVAGRNSAKDYLLRRFDGAAAAYSLQRLGTYVDDVVRVRRSTDDTESDFNAQEVAGGQLREFALNNDADLIAFADGTSPRMYFDGSNDYVEVTGMTAAVDYFGACTISAVVCPINISGAVQVVWGMSPTCYSLKINSGTWQVNATNTSISVVQFSLYTVSVTYNASGAATSFSIDGVEVWSGSAAGATGRTSFYVGAANGFGVGTYWRGIIYDFSLSGSAVKNFAFNGYGNTNDDWTDQVGSNNGTVNGSPALFSGQGFNAYVTTWYDQSGNGRNATQATAASQPQIVSNGVVVTDGNGNAAITNQTANSSIGLDYPIPANNTYWEMYLIYQAGASETTGCLVSDGDNGAAIWGIVQDGSASSPGASVTGDTYRKNGSSISSPTRDTLHTELHDGGGNLITAYATHIDTAGWAGEDVSFFQYGGSPTQFSALCKYGEIVVYQSDKSSSRAAIESNIAARYGITLA